jgi:RNA polymerase sigma-70 factor (ECF subfamily)
MQTDVDEGRARAAGAILLPCNDTIRMGRVLSHLEPRLTAVARRLVRDPDAAEDVVQNAFEKVLRHCERFRGNAQPSTWMHRIVVNEAFLWLRRETRRAPTHIEPGDWERMCSRAEDPEQAFAAREDRDRLEQALARLAERDRGVLTESVLEGRAYAALAREHGLSTGAIKSRAFRARRRLAMELATI